MTSFSRFTLTAASLTLACASLMAAGLQSTTPPEGSIAFQAKQMGVGMDGRFAKFASAVTFDPVNPSAATARFSIDVRTFDAGSEELNTAARGKSWFDTQQFPEAAFVMSKLRSTGPENFEAEGALTIKGRTRQVSVPVKFTRTKPPGALEARFQIRRSDYGIGTGAWADTSVVADEVVITVKLALREAL